MYDSDVMFRMKWIPPGLSIAILRYLIEVYFRLQWCESGSILGKKSDKTRKI